jgi:hypothetical protein
MPLFIACDDSDNLKKSEVLATEPPFNEFWLSTRFEYSNASPNTYSELKYYSAYGAELNDLSGEYRYELNDGVEVLPGDSKLTIAGSQNIVTIETSGTMTRKGEKLPVNYTGDPELWNSKTCKYVVKISINTSSMTVVSGSFELSSDTFKSQEDITNQMKISSIPDGLSIGRKNGATMTANADIRFVLDLN